MNYLFGYRIRYDGSVGFLENALTKVLNVLEDRQINYQIIYKDHEPIVKKNEDLNNYQKFLKNHYHVQINILELRG